MFCCKKIREVITFILLAGVFFCGQVWFRPSFAAAQDNSKQEEKKKPAVSINRKWDFHLQSTLIGQGVLPFRAAYSGANSLEPHGEAKDTFSFDWTTAIPLWRGGEFDADVLSWQGYGLSKTTGVAGFPNGEAYRVGKSYPDAVITRACFRQTIYLGNPEDHGPDPHTAAGDGGLRLVFTVGHFAATDVFDRNTYANDPRTQFMNWAFINNAAWDYPANSLGVTNGVSAELDLGSWAARAGIFQVSQVANGVRMDWNLGHVWSAAGELERRDSFRGHHGAVHLLAWKERAHMGSYQESLSDPQDIALEGRRQYRSKYGFGVNAEQEVCKDLGVFMRLGWANGTTQIWEFTDVDRAASLGLSLKGDMWRRSGDTVGLAAVADGITAVHRQFLASGGLGITVGDGALDYRSERLGEAYYEWKAAKRIWLTADYQLVLNPAYNHARGPAQIFGLRLHTEF